MLIENISSPADLKKLRDDEMPVLASEIRRKILDTVSKNGGHLASNLGIVELTLALHRVFDSPEDRIIFDVGHQCYTHKLITGRYSDFDTLRRTDGISGFPRRSESEHDFFGSAHSSNSISAAIGMATASKLNGIRNTTVAVIGDGAFTGGMAYEALNNCIDKDLNLIIVLNDNEMSISRNVGTIDNYFSRFRTSGSYLKFKNRFVDVLQKLPGNFLFKFFRFLKNKLKHIVLKENFFELLDLEYYGPTDGNDEKRLETLFYELKNRGKGISVVHVRTKKGLGYVHAENEPDKYHSIGSFDLEKGASSAVKTNTFSYAFGKALTELARENGDICAVTAAMISGTGLDCFEHEFPERCFDVGIAEEHAATFSAGLCSGGKIPVFAVYSTFMQRCYDQLLMDASLQSLRVILGIDRAGFVGDDGPTHHGLYDVSLLGTIPNVLVFSPDNTDEIGYCLEKCIAHSGISAVRYPRGGETAYDRTCYKKRGEIYYTDIGTPEVCVITYGRLAAECDKAARICGNARVIRLLQIIPVDMTAVLELTDGMRYILICEEGIENGGVAEKLCLELTKRGKNAHLKAVNGFAPFGAIDDILDRTGLSAKKISEALANG